MTANISDRLSDLKRTPNQSLLRQILSNCSDSFSDDEDQKTVKHKHRETPF